MAHTDFMAEVAYHAKLFVDQFSVTKVTVHLLMSLTVTWLTNFHVRYWCKVLNGNKRLLTCEGCITYLDVGYPQGGQLCEGDERMQDGQFKLLQVALDDTLKLTWNIHRYNLVTASLLVFKSNFQEEEEK